MASFISQLASFPAATGTTHHGILRPVTLHVDRPLALPTSSSAGGRVWKLVTTNSGGTFSLQCNAVSSTDSTEEDVKRNEEEAMILGQERVRMELVESIKHMLRSMGDGEISVSPYDTAWVALVKKDVDDAKTLSWKLTRAK